LVFKYDKKTRKLIITKSSTLEYNQVKLHLERHVRGFKFMPTYKRGIWDGKINHFHQGVIDMGLWKEIVISLQEIGAKLELENREDFPRNNKITLEKVQGFCEEFFKDHYVIDKKTGEEVKFFPYEHQIETAFKILRNRYCTAEVATSGGKSLIISIVYFYILKHIKSDAKFLLIVPTITLVTQFFDDMMEYNYGKFKENKNPIEIKIQEIMSDKPRKWHGEGEPNIFISTYQSLAKVDNFGDGFYTQFYGVATDEAHFAKSDSFVKILKRTMMGAKYQFGMSGTFQDDGFADYLTIQSLTGPKVAKVRAKELQEKGIISDVRISQIYLNHDDPDFRDNLKEIRKSPNSGAEAYRLEGKYVRSSEKRHEFIYKLLKNIKNNTLILFNIIEYGKVLNEYLSDKFKDENVEFYMIYGAIKKEERERIKKELEKSTKEVEYTILNFGDYKIDVKSNFKILLSSGEFKSACDITPDDDIDDDFIEKLK
jgi:superfamily II DNA or RNA helicase